MLALSILRGPSPVLAVTCLVAPVICPIRLESSQLPLRDAQVAGFPLFLPSGAEACLGHTVKGWRPDVLCSRTHIVAS